MCEDPDEFDIPIEAEDGRGELLGEYPGVEDYLRSVLVEFIHPEAVWLLACLDMAAVLRRFEAGRYRYHSVDGRVYRVAAS